MNPGSKGAQWWRSGLTCSPSRGGRGKALQLDPIDLPRPPGFKRPLCPATLALLDQALDTHSDAEAAEVLNAAGFLYWSGEPYTLRRVFRLRESCWHAGSLSHPGTMAGRLGIDPPTFTVIMGCNGAGKTTWKRAN